jgi:hypothetical protein
MNESKAAMPEKTIIPERDMHKVRCNYSSCDWGQGLAGMGRCSGRGNPKDAQCPRFTTEASDYNPEGWA